MKKPEFITFTGADARTSILDMVRLSVAYPVEFGILFSPSRQGIDLRYPSIEVIENMLGLGLKLAAHVCGDYSKAIIAGERLTEIEPILRHFKRIQINTADVADQNIVADWAGSLGAMAILQTRTEFPADYTPGIQWLFDASGGRGITPAGWPEWKGDHGLHGYAGGLSPANVGDLLSEIAQREEEECFWIDMESRVRDESNWFDLARCREVCELVYGN